MRCTMVCDDECDQRETRNPTGESMKPRGHSRRGPPPLDLHWSLGASAKKVTEENIPPSTFGNRIAETITVHTTATHHPQSNKTSCARRNLCTSLNQPSSAIPSVGLLIAQPQAITRSPLLHYHVPSPQARVVRQTRRPPARTCTYQAARKRTAERSTLAPSPITRRPHSEAGS